MKRLIVIVLILILAAGGGAGALIMLGIVPNPFAPPKKEMSAAEKAAAEMDQKNKFQAPLGAFKLVRIEDLNVPVIMNGQVTRRVYVKARLMPRSPADEAAVKAGTKQYEDAVLADLIPFFQTYFLDHDILDLAVLKQKLIRHAKDVYGEQVKDVLLENVFEQR